MTTKDPIDQLTIAELDSGSRLLKTDLVGAISEGTQDRWQALAIVAYLTARRADPKAQLTTYRNMTARELTDYLGISDDSAPVDVDQVAELAGVDVDTAQAVLVAAGVVDDVAATADDVAATADDTAAAAVAHHPPLPLAEEVAAHPTAPAPAS